jgi:hypothetical protein
MIKVAVCGMGKEKMARLINESGDGEVVAEITSDFEAAMSVQQGKVDYYMGACQSGAGGALAVATGLLGPAKVVRLSGVGSAGVTPDQIEEALENGKLAFGVSHSHIDSAVPTIVEAIRARARA